MSQVSIIGAGHIPFGAYVEKNRETGEVTDTKSLEQMIVEAGQEALADAGIDATEIDGIWVGSCSPGSFVKQEHTGPLALAIAPEAFAGKPITRTESACASSSLALYDAIYAVESGRFDTVMVVGAEKMTLCSTAEVTDILARSSYWPEEGSQGMTFPGLFAEMAKEYRDHYGFSDEQLQSQLAHVSALGYTNGCKNPLAQFGPGGLPEKKGLLTAQAILDLPAEGRGSNPMIADPLRLHDCSLVSDGAAVLIISRTDKAKSISNQAVEIAGLGHAAIPMPISARKGSLHTLDGTKKAIDLALKEAKMTMDNIRLAEVHDCFTINQLLCTEALGFSDPGRAGIDYEQGRFTVDDEVSVNLSGGLKAKGHPVGATGVSMHAMMYKQLIGKPSGVAAKGNPESGIVINVGGSAVTNCATILRRL